LIKDKGQFVKKSWRSELDLKKKQLEFQYTFIQASLMFCLPRAIINYYYLLVLANDLAGGLLAWTFAHWTSGL